MIRDPRHLDAVRQLPCCLTLWPPPTGGGNDAAHLRHFTGTGMKPPDNHVLPLRREVHMYEHSRPHDFWASAGFPFGTDNDPRIWAERLHECADHEEREALVHDMVRRANRRFIVNYVLREIAGQAAGGVGDLRISRLGQPKGSRP